MKSRHVAFLAVYVLFLVFGATGCSTVPVNVDLSHEQQALDLSSKGTKYPFSVGLVIPDAFPLQR